MDPQTVTPQPVPTPPPPAADEPQPKKSRKGLIITVVIIVLLLAAVAVAAAYFMSQNTQTGVKSENTPTPSSQVQPSPSSPPSLIDFTSKKVAGLSFPSYRISYPSGWAAKDETDDVMSTFTLTKGNYEIKITQAPREGTQCIFEGVMPTGDEGSFATDYTKSEYVEFSNKMGVFRRVSSKTPQEATLYTFCYKMVNSENTFGSPTVYGDIVYTAPSTPDETVLSEMDEIVKTLQAIPLAP